MTDVRYTLTVWITQPVEVDDDPRAYCEARVRGELERSVIKALGKLDGDADCEVIDTEIVDDGNPDEDEAYERAAARARGNDFEDTGGKDWT